MRKITILSLVASMAIFFGGCNSTEEPLNTDVGLSKDFKDSWQTGEFFYYYGKEKMPLKINTKYIYVSSTKRDAIIGSTSDANSVNLVDFGVKYDMTEVKETLDETLDGNPLTFYWAELELLEKLDEETYKKKLDQIRMSNKDVIVAPYFSNSVTDKIGLSQFFVVRLKSAEDIAILKEVAAKTNVVILKESLDPLWFAVSLTPQSEKNALDMANWYCESNLFQTAEPDLMSDELDDY